MDAVKVGKSIAFLRKRYHMTQRNVADILEISDKAVSKWERGIGTPDISLLGKLATIFDTDIESILEGNLANMNLNWCGMLYLDYADGIFPSVLIYDKPIVYYQLSYLMLAGICNVHVIGTRRNISLFRSCLPDVRILGLTATFHESSETDVEKAIHEEMYGEYTRQYGIDCSKLDGIMQVTGADFIYGKDVTKTFRRLLYNTALSVSLEAYSGERLHIRFLRIGQSCRGTQPLERGVCAFPVENYVALQDAANIVCILKRQQKENIADLTEIAMNRGLIE